MYQRRIITQEPQLKPLTRKSFWKPLALISVCGAGLTLPLQAATYYVKPNGANTGGTTQATALNWVAARNLAAADPNTNDTIIFLPGEYMRGPNGNLGATGNNYNLLDVPTNTTVKALNRAQDSVASDRSILKGAYSPTVGTIPIYNFIEIAGESGEPKADIVVEGFEIDGGDTNKDTATGRSTAGGIDFKGNCVRIKALYNLIHDIGGPGVITFNFNSDQDGPHQGIPGGADYVTVKGNRIFNACYWATGGGGGSGISLLGTYNTAPYEDSRTVHNFIQQNRIYNCNNQSGATLTDNNGIILDLMGGHSDLSSSGVGYRRPARTLVENNVIYGNDGRGIHVFKSSNALIRNNTCYKNDIKITGKAELSAFWAADVLFSNNVAYGNGVNAPLKAEFDGTGSRGNITCRYNTTNTIYTSNTTSPVPGANFYAGGVVQYNNRSGLLDSGPNRDFWSPGTFDFRTVTIPNYTPEVQRIINVGSGATVTFPNNNDFAPNDFYGAGRSSDSVDCGAFESSLGRLKLPVN